MTDMCKGCGLPIVTNDSRYAGREPDEHWHWYCHQRVADRYESTRSELPAVIERMNNSMARLRRAVSNKLREPR